jgi:hypothetical protein
MKVFNNLVAFCALPAATAFTIQGSKTQPTLLSLSSNDYLGNLKGQSGAIPPGVDEGRVVSFLDD